MPGPPGNDAPEPSLGIGPVAVSPRSWGGSGGASGGVPGGRIASGVSSGPAASEDAPGPNLARASVSCPSWKLNSWPPASVAGVPGDGAPDSPEPSAFASEEPFACAPGNDEPPASGAGKPVSGAP